MRVCQFRHDGKWTSVATAASRRRVREDLQVYFTDPRLCVKPLNALPVTDWRPCQQAINRSQTWSMSHSIAPSSSGSSAARSNSPIYSSFALIVIFAFNTFETGHPFSAASAYFWKVAASAPGTLPTTSM